MKTEYLLCFSLCMIVTAQNIILDYIKAKNNGELKFHMGSMVTYCEGTKFLLTLILWILFDDNKLEKLQSMDKTRLKLALPSFIYVTQNTLSYYVFLFINSPTFSLFSNLKILTTVVAMYFVMNVEICKIRMFMMLQLFLGMLVSCNLQTKKISANLDIIYGFLICLLIATLSSLSNTLTEKLLKMDGMTFLFKTLHIYAFTFIISLLNFTYDPNDITIDVIIMLSINVMCGMCISLVLKLQDNYVKLFSVTMSTFLSAFISSTFLNVKISGNFVVGAIIVFTSINVFYSVQNTKKCNEEEKNLLFAKTNNNLYN